MHLRQLANFVRIVELGSFSQAASEIRIAQPALSRQVRLLEKEFGTDLLERHGWGVRPTEAGMLLMDHAHRVLREVTVTRDAMMSHSSTPVGRLAVGVPSSMAMILLPRLGLLAQQRWPQLMLTLGDAFSAIQHRAAISGLLDLAVLYEDGQMNGLMAIPLLEEDIVLVRSQEKHKAASTVSIKELRTIPLLLPARPNRLRLIIDALSAQMNLPLDVKLEVDSVPALLALVGEGVGCTLLPYSAVATPVLENRLSVAAIEPARLKRRLVLASPAHRPRTLAATVVAEAIFEIIHAEQRKYRWTPLSDGRAGREIKAATPSGTGR